MLKIYGTDLCQDCLDCKEELDRKGKAYVFLDINKSLSVLKEFLVLRDKYDVFIKVKEQGLIGIPTLLFDDGLVSLDWQVYVKK